MTSTGVRGCDKEDKCYCSCWVCKEAIDSLNLPVQHCQVHDYGCHMGCVSWSLPGDK